MEFCVFDDEKIFQSALNDAIEDYLDVRHPEMDYSVHCFATTNETLNFVNANSVDVVFLDITTSENEEDGLIVARSIRSINENIHIVFVTSRKDKIAKSFDGFVRPTDFLIKPVKTDRVFDLLDSIVRQRLHSSEYITFKFGRTEYLFNIDEICSLQKFAHKMVVSTENRSIEVTNTISSLIETLPKSFIQIDKGLIVNLNHIITIDYAERSVVLKNGARFTMSRNARTAVKNAVCQLVGGTTK